VRDLIKDKEICERALVALKCNYPPENYTMLRTAIDNVIEGWPEAIERAIAAESKLNELAEIEGANCPEDYGFEEYTKVLVKRNGLLTEENARLTAQVAGLRDVLEFYSNKNHWPDGPAVYPGGTPIPPIMKDNGARARQVLASPDPGEKYRKVVEAAWTVFKTNGMSGILISDLGKALAELEAANEAIYSWQDNRQSRL